MKKFIIGLGVMFFSTVNQPKIADKLNKVIKDAEFKTERTVASNGRGSSGSKSTTNESKV